jgi:biotin transport system substrate-specific component
MRRISPSSLTQNRWPAAPVWLYKAALAIIGSLALAVSAKIQHFPYYPVPLTLQTLVVLLIGGLYGARLGAATVALYLAEGAVGLPVFASGSGLLYMSGPTGGFLGGFLLAAYGVGLACERGYLRNLVGASLVMILGHLVIFLCGFAWLAVLFGPAKAWLVGVLPFITVTIVKTALAVLLVSVWRNRLPLARLRLE